MTLHGIAPGKSAISGSLFCAVFRTVTKHDITKHKRFLISVQIVTVTLFYVGRPLRFRLRHVAGPSDIMF